MRRTLFVILPLALAAAGAGGPGAGPGPGQGPGLDRQPGRLQALVSPDCSHCQAEAKRRRKDLRADDRVLCWRQELNGGYTNDGAVPVRFFLSPSRALSDSWGSSSTTPTPASPAGPARRGGTASTAGATASWS
jgi:hypothetical protein